MRYGDALDIYIRFALQRLLMSKLEHIASKVPKIVADLEARAEKLDDKVSKLEKRGNDVFNKWDDHLDSQEKAVSVAEDAINRLSNAAPPFRDAVDKSTATDDK